MDNLNLASDDDSLFIVNFSDIEKSQFESLVLLGIVPKNEVYAYKKLYEKYKYAEDATSSWVNVSSRELEVEWQGDITKVVTQFLGINPFVFQNKTEASTKQEVLTKV